MGLIHEKTEGLKSRETVPLNVRFRISFDNMTDQIGYQVFQSFQDKEMITRYGLSIINLLERRFSVINIFFLS
jgi:hypothetical protein